MNRNAKSRYVVLDVETTGLSPMNGHRIIEIGAIAIEDRNMVEEFSTLIDIDQPIPWQASNVHVSLPTRARGLKHRLYEPLENV